VSRLPGKISTTNTCQKVALARGLSYVPPASSPLADRRLQWFTQSTVARTSDAFNSCITLHCTSASLTAQMCATQRFGVEADRSMLNAH
jgi:hypothetical protein